MMIFLDKRRLHKNHPIIKTPAQIPSAPIKNKEYSNASQCTILPVNKDTRKQVINIKKSK